MNTRLNPNKAEFKTSPTCSGVKSFSSPLAFINPCATQSTASEVHKLPASTFPGSEPFTSAIIRTTYFPTFLTRKLSSLYFGSHFALFPYANILISTDTS